MRNAASMNTVTTFALPGGIITFDLPAVAELDLADAPMSGGFGFGGDRWVWFLLMLVDLSESAPDEFEVDAFAQALDPEENLAEVVAGRGGVFADLMAIDGGLGEGGPAGRWFLRMDRLDNGVVRILKVAAGCAEGESEAERTEADRLAFAVAQGARFSPMPTPLDRTAGKPGTFVLTLPRCVVCPLPPGWSIHPPEEIDPEWEGEEDGTANVICLAYDDAVSMFVGARSLSPEAPLTEEELAEAVAGFRESDLGEVEDLHGMGARVEATPLGPTAYWVRGDFDKAALGVDGRHYRVRALSADRMVEVDLSPILTDPDADPADVEGLIGPLEDYFRRAVFYLQDGEGGAAASRSTEDA